MTTTYSHPDLNIQLIPKVEPEAIPNIVNQPLSPRERQNLLVQPGTSSEMVLQLENLTNPTLELEINIKGNFPSQWCTWWPKRFSLESNEQRIVEIHFAVEANFLERNNLNQQSFPLNLDYEGRIEINYSLAREELQFLETKEFNLYLRPHSLYLDFLPSIYREVDFVGRMLKIFENTFEPSVNQLKSLWAYLDPLTSSEALLPFLAYWVGWQMEQDIDIKRQRHLIRQAISIYHWRGTKRGLRLYLHLYTGLPEDEQHIAIEEPIGPGFIMGDSHLGRETILGGGRAYHFTVRLRSAEPNKIDPVLVRKIIEQEKPCWCTYEVYIEELGNESTTTT